MAREWSNVMFPEDPDGLFQCYLSGYTSLQAQQNQRYDQNKKSKRIDSEKAQSILNCGHSIADIGDKSANRGSTTTDYVYASA